MDNFRHNPEATLERLWDDLLRADITARGLRIAGRQDHDAKLEAQCKEVIDLLGRAFVVLEGMQPKRRRVDPPDDANGAPSRKGKRTAKLPSLRKGEQGHREEGTEDEPASTPIQPPGPYPRFERDDDKLVKYGWSEKKGVEYRHAVDFDLILQLAGYLSESRRLGNPFRLRQVARELVDQGLELSNYQLYSAVDWLMEEGWLEKIGEGVYVLAADRNVPGELAERWDQMAQQ